MEGDTAQPQQPAVTFSDVPAGQYFTPPVAWAVEQGLTQAQITQRQNKAIRDAARAEREAQEKADGKIDFPELRRSPLVFSLRLY